MSSERDGRRTRRFITSAAKERAERRAVLRGGGPDDPQPRKPEGTTYHQLAAAEFSVDRGRFTAREKAAVTGAEPVKYPRLPETSPWHHDPLPAEEPLGLDVNAMVPTGEPHEVQASIDKLGGAPSDDMSSPILNVVDASPGEARVRTARASRHSSKKG
jgi:hypothetical protein